MKSVSGHPLSLRATHSYKIRNVHARELTIRNNIHVWYYVTSHLCLYSQHTHTHTHTRAHKDHRSKSAGTKKTVKATWEWNEKDRRSYAGPETDAATVAMSETRRSFPSFQKFQSHWTLTNPVPYNFLIMLLFAPYLGVKCMGPFWSRSETTKDRLTFDLTRHDQQKKNG